MKRQLLIVCVSACLGATGCVASPPDTANSGNSQVSTAKDASGLPQAQALLIQGYNYTDMFIDSFTVNGAGGGNIFVSSPTAGGGGSVCCYSFNPSARRPIPLKIRWAAAYCMEHKASPYSFGPRFVDERKTLWKEAVVPLSEVSTPAMALEVHFYPDGHVEAAVTPGYSPPRLKLPITADEQRPGASSSFPPCSHDQLQQGH
ncbi:DUF3304 domain-containing protein [Aquabacterium sp.]|uniref:DUF3304 domain-containing protein n=1 Tax=Aquabacterium sp. TaxID=1872578 RepID=UPI004037A928